jgi:hypothetical protein
MIAMVSLRLTSCLVVVLLVAQGEPRPDGRQIRNIVKSTGELSMGGGVSRLENTCVAFVAYLSASDFFLRLRRTETSKGPEYWNGHELATKFPSNLQVNVLMHVWRCPGDTQLTDPIFEATLQPLQWRLAWKRGMKVRSIDEFEFRLTATSTSEWEKRTGHPFCSLQCSDLSAPGQSRDWIASLAIRGQDAPLTDSLVLSVDASSGKHIARFSGHL